MANLTKIVNIKATLPVRNVNPPILGEQLNVKMSQSDILKCLCRRAIVHEVLSDGSLIRLTTQNFREDFEGQLKKKMENEKKIKKAVKKEDPKPVGETKKEDDFEGEPEEPFNTVVSRTYLDGTIIETTGIKANYSDPEDNPDDDYELHPITETVNTVSSNNNKKVIKKKEKGNKKK